MSNKNITTRVVKRKLADFGFLPSDYSVRTFFAASNVVVSETGSHRLAAAYRCLASAGFTICNAGSYERDGRLLVQV